MRYLQILILIIVSSFLFLACPNEKKNSEPDANTLLLSALISQRFSCADVKANSNSTQLVPFRLVNATGSSSGNYFAYVYVNLTQGQKLSIASLTTNLTKFSGFTTYSNCGASSMSATIFNGSVSTNNFTLTALQTFEGLVGVSALVSNVGASPTDVTVQTLP
ncbi:hypothetical protein EHQ97_00300 [Leptospira adleri]|nr:hypothetical protein EHQ97_00300 [Leptospira adleri]